MSKIPPVVEIPWIGKIPRIGVPAIAVAMLSYMAGTIAGLAMSERSLTTHVTLVLSALVPSLLLRWWFQAINDHNDRLLALSWRKWNEWLDEEIGPEDDV